MMVLALLQLLLLAVGLVSRVHLFVSFREQLFYLWMLAIMCCRMGDWMHAWEALIVVLRSEESEHDYATCPYMGTSNLV